MAETTGDERLQARRRLLKGAALAGASFAAGGWAADGASAAPAPPAANPRDGFNVRAFGAMGDGRTSDTRPVQAAIDACLKAGGGLIYFPAGRYLINHTLRIGSADSVDIVGDGASSTLLHQNDEPLLEWPEVVSCRECSVRHLCFTSVGQDKSRETAVIACNGGAERSFFSHLLFNSSSAI